MKTNEQDMDIKDLFRQKLEKAEVIPDPKVQLELMRKLARREFVRFDPGRFNLYYLGLILAAAITAGILLFSKLETNQDQTPFRIPDDQVKTGTSGYFTIPESQAIKAESGIQKTFIDTIKNIKRVEVAVNSDSHEVTKKENNKIAYASINKTSTGGRLFNKTSADYYKLQQKSSEKVMFEPSAFSGCSPLRVHFYNKVSSFDSCRWTFGNSGYSNKENPDWVFDIPGDYEVSLRIFERGGLKSMYTAMISVFPKPNVRFEITPEKAVIPDEEIQFLNYSTEAVNYKWEFGDGTTSDLFEPKHKYTKFSNYRIKLTLTTEYGCIDSLTVDNAFSDSGFFIDMPNAFIPNPEGPSGGLYSSKSDESAQIFHPVYSGVSDYRLRIFSKIGILIFESKDLSIGWDGYFKGQFSQPGVYIWEIRGTFINGEPFIKRGDITLLSN